MVVITDDGTHIGSGIVYGRGIIVDGGSNGGADGSGMQDVWCIAQDGAGDVQGGGSGVIMVQ